MVARKQRRAESTQNTPSTPVFVVPGGNFASLPFISDWERAVGKPVKTTNQALLWAMVQMIRVDEELPGFGRLFQAVGSASLYGTMPRNSVTCGTTFLLS